jgi:2-amino-4-hydroxy-6-hydroxymethyldihydropteridine diphosphokinase
MSQHNAVYGYVSLGSNMGDPLANVRFALKLLDEAEVLGVDAVSPVYWTEPQGMREQDWFANCVARLRVDASLSPEDLLDAVASVETGMGRVRTTHWGPRIIDIDILLLGDLEWNAPRLQIPHPRMCDRAFVLVPLMHLAPNILIRGLCPSQWLSRLRYSVEGDRILQE